MSPIDDAAVHAITLICDLAPKQTEHRKHTAFASGNTDIVLSQDIKISDVKKQEVLTFNFVSIIKFSTYSSLITSTKF